MQTTKANTIVPFYHNYSQKRTCVIYCTEKNKLFCFIQQYVEYVGFKFHAEQLKIV